MICSFRILPFGSTLSEPGEVPEDCRQSSFPSPQLVRSPKADFCADFVSQFGPGVIEPKLDSSESRTSQAKHRDFLSGEIPSCCLCSSRKFTCDSFPSEPPDFKAGLYPTDNLMPFLQ
jgi:hypothetical protein